MKVLHYCPHEREIRFFSLIKKNLREELGNIKSISDNQDIYIPFYEHKQFISKLHLRRKLPDVAIITAHGGHNSILKATRYENYEKVIDLSQTTLFQNDFVFALSCSTAKNFGPSSIQNNAFTYIGFDDYIGQVFQIKSDKYKRLYRNITLMIRNIYMNSFTLEFSKFLKECMTADEFIQSFSYRINFEILKLYKMPIDDMNKKYNVKFLDKDDKVIKQTIKLELISKFDYFSKKMKVLGEENYIPWFFIKDQTSEKLHEVLIKSDKIDKKNNRYKIFLQSEIYKALNDTQNSEKCNTLLEQMDEITFYSEIYTESEIAASIKN